MAVDYKGKNLVQILKHRDDCPQKDSKIPINACTCHCFERGIFDLGVKHGQKMSEERRAKEVVKDATPSLLGVDFSKDYTLEIKAKAVKEFWAEFMKDKNNLPVWVKRLGENYIKENFGE